MVLDDKTLVLPLKQPFGAIAEMSKNKDWCHIPDTFRIKYMTVIISIAKEVDMAKDYLGWNYQATQFAV
jgi:hypothetical protein